MLHYCYLKGLSLQHWTYVGVKWNGFNLFLKKAFIVKHLQADHMPQQLYRIIFSPTRIWRSAFVCASYALSYHQRRDLNWLPVFIWGRQFIGRKLKVTAEKVKSVKLPKRDEAMCFWAANQQVFYIFYICTCIVKSYISNSVSLLWSQYSS